MNKTEKKLEELKRYFSKNPLAELEFQRQVGQIDMESMILILEVKLRIALKALYKLESDSKCLCEKCDKDVYEAIAKIEKIK